MNYFTQRRLLILAVVVLLLLNLATLGTFWFFRSGKSKTSSFQDRPHKVETFLIDKLAFDSLQSKELRRLMEEHRAGARRILKSMQASREMLFNPVFLTDSMEVDQITGKIATAQAALDKATYYHFKSIREICNPDQQQKFDAIVKDVIRRHHPGYRRLKKRHSSSGD